MPPAAPVQAQIISENQPCSLLIARVYHSDRCVACPDYRPTVRPAITLRKFISGHHVPRISYPIRKQDAVQVIVLMLV